MSASHTWFITSRVVKEIEIFNNRSVSIDPTGESSEDEVTDELDDEVDDFLPETANVKSLIHKYADDEDEEDEESEEQIEGIQDIGKVESHQFSF